MTSPPILDAHDVRRLALARGGLLRPKWTGLPERATGRGRRARRAALTILDRFGYLQLDTVSIAGARSHTLVLLSRLEGFPAELGEALLQPGEPLFEYWGHQASWMPMDLYPVFAFRRRRFRRHPWWGDIIGAHRTLSRDILGRIRKEGPLRSADLEGKDGGGWWAHKPAKKVVSALWSSGRLAVRERRNFQRSFDLAERVIPPEVRGKDYSTARALPVLLLRALEGHGWATTGTLAATWQLRNMRQEITSALKQLAGEKRVLPCVLDEGSGRRVRGWVRPEDLALAHRLRRVRPRRDRGVLLSPFDPVLWDRKRVRRLFDFDQILEIFKPAPERVYGYYCLPVLAGENLIGRVDLKADRRRGHLEILSLRYESTGTARAGSAEERAAVESALERYEGAVGLRRGRVAGAGRPARTGSWG